ncbi:hypothetical protein [Streptomyces sp. NPDC059788]|uniref:hypothetical protein n=1 Tax=Streptomyces sp. NPDC059788 TaxID=3346948 RepID=UPI0036602C0E
MAHGSNEPRLTSRDDDWLVRCRFSRDETLRRASDADNQIKFNNQALAQWNKYFASRSDA